MTRFTVSDERIKAFGTQTLRDDLRREFAAELHKIIKEVRTENVPALQELGETEAAKVRDFGAMLVMEALLSLGLSDQAQAIQQCNHESMETEGPQRGRFFRCTQPLGHESDCTRDVTTKGPFR